jgi:hypothetical protein
MLNSCRKNHNSDAQFASRDGKRPRDEIARQINWIENVTGDIHS